MAKKRAVKKPKRPRRPQGPAARAETAAKGRPNGPAAELVEAGNSDEWRIELKNFGQFWDTLGSDVLTQFCRCFVHVDRLNSMVSFAYISEQHYGSDSVAFARDLHTMVWFTIGTLRELALAIKDLRSALAKRGIFDPSSDQWKKLSGIEERWERTQFYRKMRNKVAFHVDRDLIEKGLRELTSERDVVLSRGEGKKGVRSSLTLGLEAMHNGLGIDLPTYGQFLATVSEDHGATLDAIQLAFVEAVQSAGIPFGGKLG